MSHKREGQILKEEMGKGLGALRRSAAGLFVSGLSGGLDVGFSLLAMGIVVTIGQDLGDVAFRLLLAGAYAIGFVFVVLGRSELFTEQTTLAVLPVLGAGSTHGGESVTSGFKRRDDHDPRAAGWQAGRSPEHYGVAY